MTLLPPKDGLKREWQPGEVAVRCCYDVVHSLILEPAHQYSARFSSVLCLDSSGIINCHNPQDLLTIEGYRKHCEYMRRDWTGREYDERVERALTGLPFEVPAYWGPDMISEVVKPLNPEYAAAVRKALGFVHEF